MNWDKFWKIKENDPIANIDKPKNISEVGWKVMLEEWHERFQQLSNGKSMLECGCGMATLSRYFASQGYLCTMLDSSEDALIIAKSVFSKDNLKGKFLKGDIVKLPFPNDSFDIIYNGGCT